MGKKLPSWQRKKLPELAPAAEVTFTAVESVAAFFLNTQANVSADELPALPKIEIVQYTSVIVQAGMMIPAVESEVDEGSKPNEAEK